MQALENNDSVILNKWRAVIQHEASHIKNNDIFWRAIFELIAPFMIGSTANYFVSTYKHTSFWHKQYFIVYFGLVSFAFHSLQDQFSVSIKNNEQIILS